MGFREALRFGFVLLLSIVNLCSPTQNGFNISTNETSDQIPRQQQATTSSQLQPNLTRHGDPGRSPVTYRLKSYQLWSSSVSKQKQLQAQMEETSQNQQGPEQPEQPEQPEPPGDAVKAQELLKLPVRGPDLNPPTKQAPKVLVRFEPRLPEAAVSVAARCGERQVTVEVKQNFLGNGQAIRPSDLTLGGCAALDAADHILHFQTELQGCSSTLTMTDEALVYSFPLTYSPTPIGDTVILRTNPAEVVIECHYRRRHYVSSNAVRPSWKPFASNMLAEQQLHFSLRLMTEDWQSQRRSGVYFPGDVMHVEAAVLQGHHVPLRVYVDSCVATANPDPNSEPRYPFISNHGCLSDAKLTGAKSYFMQRSQEDKLHFQLRAFRFHQDHRNSLYVTCHLKATTVSVPIDSRHKACSFLTEANRWVASGGDNKVCSCCETSCSEQRQKRGLGADAGLPPDLQWEGTAALGPVLLEGNVALEEELTEPPEPAPLLQTHEAASDSSVALLCGAGAMLSAVLLAFTGAVVCGKLHKPSAHAVWT